jgi:signal transduction histidine kinase/CHASE3 domain sensor protein
MIRRLTVRTLAVSALIIVVVGAVLGVLALAIDRQHDAGDRARSSQAASSAANLTQQRLLAVQTTIRGFLIRGNPTVLSDYRAVRESFPAAALELQGLVANNPGQSRLAQEIRRQARSYVDSYADPVIERTREAGVSEGRKFAAANDGSARADELAALIGRLGGTERTISQQRAKDADKASSRALLTAGLGFALCVLVLVFATTYVARRIVMPVGRLASAATRVQRGELDVSVPERRGDEIGRLGGAFNEMARALEQSRGELESQNTELEMQAIELEERQVELTEANDEARAQRDELEISAGHLAEEKARAERYGEFANRLATSRNAADLAEIALSTLAAVAGADVGVLYTENWRDDTRWARTAVLALDPAPLAEYAPAGGEGAGARAVAARSVVVVDDAGAGLRVRTGLAGEAVVRWEVHVPLRSGDRDVGVAALGGVTEATFDPAEAGTLQRLAAQAAVALTEAGALAQRSWLSQVNSAVLDCVREGIALVGLDHELVFANTAMERLARRLSMPVPAAIGAARADAPADDPETYFAKWEAMLADTDEPTADELDISGLVLERYTAPVDDEAGARIGRLVVLRDVTREREVDQLKSDLMATVSHELRTPLASVLGYAELLRTRRLDADARDEILGTVHREAKRLSSLIDDFLDVQAIEQDRLTLTREPFSVTELLEEQVRTFAGQSAKHHVRLSPCESPTMAIGDRGRIAQVVANLLSNAIKYSPDGGDVGVSASCTAGVVQVAVTDAGLGIPAADQQHVFEKFFRVDHGPAQRVGGTGLGLALAHKVVVAHGGRMGFESTEGAGSRFWFELPTE